MKLLLCSEGFHTQNTVEKCAELVGKDARDISVAIINEAFAVEKGDKRWVLNNLNDAATNFGGEVDIVDLLALSLEEVEQRIMSKDVIFVIGGNTDYLMSVFQKTGFGDLLPKLLESKIYVGSSAGSMVIGKRVSEACYELIYGGESPYGVTDYLGLVDFSIMPHLDSPYFPYRKESLLATVGEFTGKVYGLRDDSAVVVSGNEIYTIGSDPIIIENGEVL